ncbi:MAG: MFS transporter, partial [Sphingomonadales bacterium]|nr:MFS transporter [Sphingomonadales bacterium]
FGLRRVGHAGLIAFLTVAAGHLLLASAGDETLTSFIVLQALSLMSFAFCSANFSTLAMTNMGSIAGTASSVQGVVSTIVGATIGLIIGQAFNGTVLPFLAGAALCAAAALGLVLATERGRLMEPLAA